MIGYQKKVVINFIRGDNGQPQTGNYNGIITTIQQILVGLANQGYIYDQPQINQLYTYNVTQGMKPEIANQAAQMIVKACSPFNAKDRQKYEKQSNEITFTIAEDNRLGSVGQSKNVFEKQIRAFAINKATTQPTWKFPLCASRVLFFDNVNTEKPPYGNQNWEGINQMLKGYWFGFKNPTPPEIYKPMYYTRPKFLETYLQTNIKTYSPRQPLQPIQFLHIYGTLGDIQEFTFFRIQQIFHAYRLETPKIQFKSILHFNQQGYPATVAEIFNPLIRNNEATIARTDLKSMKQFKNSSFNLLYQLNTFRELNPFPQVLLQHMFRFIFIDKSSNTPENYQQKWKLNGLNINIDNFVYAKNFSSQMIIYLIQSICIATYGKIIIVKKK